MGTIIKLRWSIVALCMAMTACSNSSSGGNDSGTMVDASTTDTSQSDATADSADAAADGNGAGSMGCDLGKPWQPPQLLMGITGAVGSLSPDELTIYYSRIPDNMHEFLYVATRASKTDPFSNETQLTTFNQAYQRWPSVPADGLTIYFEWSMPNYIYVATRANVNASFGTPKIILAIDGNQGAYDPFITPDGLRLYYNFNHYTDVQNGNYSAPNVVNFGGIPNGCSNMITSADQLTAFIGCDPTGSNMDIYAGTRAKVTDAFTNIFVQMELNSSDYDVPNWMTPDGCRIYLSSFRNGSAQIFMASRPPK